VTRDEFERRAVEFVRTRLLPPGDDTPVHAETPLFECGVLNSLRILDLIAFVEKTLDARLPDKAIRLKNFRSVRAIADAFVADPGDADDDTTPGGARGVA
jgi:acyl carrier protein